MGVSKISEKLIPHNWIGLIKQPLTCQILIALQPNIESAVMIVFPHRICAFVDGLLLQKPFQYTPRIMNHDGIGNLRDDHLFQFI